MPTLNCLMVTDGRPGHQKQSLGIIEALGNYMDLNLQQEVISPGNAFSEALRLLKFFLTPSSVPDTRTYDIVIGTGSRTHVPLLMHKKRGGARAMTCMSPPLYLKSYFDLCFIPKHDRCRPSPNYFETIGPPNTNKPSAEHRQDRGLILVGGVDESSHQWRDEQVLSSIKRLVSTRAVTHWTVSSSPRTPESTEQGLRALASEQERLVFLPFAETAGGWVDNQYRLNKTVWITGDSMSMIYEALSAGCQVGILPVSWKRADNKFAHSLADLLTSRRIVTLEGWLDGREEWQEQQPLDEADRCAREILRRWWPTSLR